MVESICTWRDGLPDEIITRFAPSPTGWLHLGHVLSAMYVWGMGRALGAKIILRIEDHDLGRSRREFEQGIVDDLTWLGLTPDEGVENTDMASLHRQSDHLHDYDTAIGQLLKTGRAYACDCSRMSIKARTGIGHSELRYDGYCRDRNVPMDGDVGIRLRVDHSKEEFWDALHGHVVQIPAEQCGDFLLRDRRGYYTYHAAVAIDDYRDRVNLIIRGEDVLPGTGRQHYLRRLLGDRRPMHYLHHPLIRDGEQKLSKRDGVMGIRQLRAKGLSAADVWRLATVHLSPKPVESLEDAIAYFMN